MTDNNIIIIKMMTITTTWFLCQEHKALLFSGDAKKAKIQEIVNSQIG